MILLSVSSLTFSQELTLQSTKNNALLSISEDTISLNRDVKGAISFYTDDGRNWTFDSYAKLSKRPNRIKGILKHMRFSRTINVEYSDRKYSFRIR